MTARVAVNLLWCTPGQVGGSEEYLARQLSGFGTVDDGFATTLLCSPAWRGAHPDVAARFAVETAPDAVRRRPLRIALEHTWLAARTRGVDLVHHGGGTAPAVGARPLVLTVHDLQYLDHPEYHSATKLAYLRAIVPRSAHRAAVVTTPTEWVRATVVERLGIEPDRVLVVRHGVDRVAVGALPDAAALRSRFGLGDGPFVVFPAITHPHKGHDFLLQTMARCWRDPDLRLVLLGGRGAADDAVERTIDACDLRSRVVRPGRVGERDRDGLLAAASALVFPSRYEGFGAPVIEAMALGTPVVCSDHPTLTEVAGQAALVLPLERDAWAGALDEVDRRRDELRAAGLDRAAGFTVAESGADLRAAYLRAIEVGR